MKSEQDEGRALEEAFLQDHQDLTRGLTGMLEALEAGDLDSAGELARELDRTAGPHIEFEERAYYPELRKTLGPTFVAELYREHAAARRALRTLIDRDPRDPLSDPERETLLADLRVARNHALSCGSLLSHLAPDPAREKLLLTRLREARKRGRRWTELPPHGPKEPRR